MAQAHDKVPYRYIYVKLQSEACIYVRLGQSGIEIVAIYVDDLLFIEDRECVKIMKVREQKSSR